jgi:predicted AAA+ superfamily ATPase
MHQIIYNDIYEGANGQQTDPKRAIYASLSNPLLKKNSLLDIIKIYTKYILREDISKIKKPIFVFLDEIQDVNWGDQIKTIVDLEYPIKLIVTGSSSTAMLEESTKAARRVVVYPMLPFKFSDYTKYVIKSEKFDEAISALRKLRVKIRNEFKNNNSEKIYEEFISAYTLIKEWETTIQLCFDEYLVKGGYPGLFDIKDEGKYQDILSQSFWLGFHKDLALAKGVGDPIGMRQLIEYIAATSSCDSNYTALMENSKSGTNTEMVKKYIYHLERAFLVKISHQHAKSPVKKTQFKTYLCDIAARNLLSGMMNQLLFKNHQQYGFAIQTLIFEHAMRLNYKFTNSADVYYWKDAKTEKEVDVVMDLKEFTIPIEVKKSDEPDIREVKGLLEFCKGKPGIVTCGKKLAAEDNIIYVPHWLFCLIC